MELFLFNKFELLVVALYLLFHFFKKQPPKKKKEVKSSSLAEVIRRFWGKIVDAIMGKTKRALAACFSKVLLFAFKVVRFFAWALFSSAHYLLGFVFIFIYLLLNLSSSLTNICRYFFFYFKVLSKSCYVYWNEFSVRALFIQFFWFCWGIKYFTFLQKIRFLVYWYFKFFWLIINFIRFLNYFWPLIFYLFCVFIYYVDFYVARDCKRLFVTTLKMLSFWDVVRDILKNASRAYLMFYNEYLIFIENLYLYSRKKKFLKKPTFYNIYNFLIELKWQLSLHKFFLKQQYTSMARWVSHIAHMKFNSKNDYF